MLTHSSYLSRLKRFIARYSGSRPVCSSFPAVGPAAETPAIAPARSSRVRALDSPRVPDSPHARCRQRRRRAEPVSTWRALPGPPPVSAITRS